MWSVVSCSLDWSGTIFWSWNTTVANSSAIAATATFNWDFRAPTKRLWLLTLSSNCLFPIFLSVFYVARWLYYCIGHLQYHRAGGRSCSSTARALVFLSVWSLRVIGMVVVGMDSQPFNHIVYFSNFINQLPPEGKSSGVILLCEFNCFDYCARLWVAKAFGQIKKTSKSTRHETKQQAWRLP